MRLPFVVTATCTCSAASYLMSDGSDSPEPDLEETTRFLQDRLGDDASLYDISPSGELFRAISRFNNRTARLAQVLGELDRTAEEAHATRLRVEQLRRSMSSSNNLRDRVRRQRARLVANRLGSTGGAPGIDVAPPGYTANPSVPPQGSGPPPRPRMTESGRLLEVHRSLTEGRRRSPTLASLEEMYQSGQQLQQAMSQTRSRFEAPRIEQLLAPAQEQGDENSRAFKRRRLGSPVTESRIPAVNYGYYGQVEPGKLNMEIEFCDGGTFSEGSERDSIIYGAANVLKTDNSVYSTKSNRCNLVLKHEGDRPFCLKEIIIKAPPRGYTAPVQEGMVFISMDADDLLTRTTKYQIQYLPTPHRRNARGNPVAAAPVISIRHNDDGSTTATRQSPTVYTDGSAYSRPAAQIPTDFTDPACTPPFRVTTSCSSDTESDAGSSTSSRRYQRANRNRARERRREERERMGHALMEYGETSSEDSEEEPPAPIELDWTDEVGDWGAAPPPRSRSRSGSRGARRSQPSVVSLGLENAIEAADEATEEAVKAVDGRGSGQGLMAPHARFFIERDKSRCRLVFEPEVSGRYILLKMWSPEVGADGNIDIQSIVVKGWCGGRWFPKVTLR
ncbi:hypothetical protein VE01_02490 [Pseudogymnoascus verrucosus]|uniref:Uncharacterized protein n=1 Tax=Pseudogymnoascus verrucosus TaxID=342668 RepID=A0A1B8GT50_9PEZI|nr:uncharacterized protein VE01_02490 [Pseudogymnoascus verrucosus]OBT99014.2 hypothetical protein VE01_02490 [Pseudogymnoascus verrucosus]